MSSADFAISILPLHLKKISFSRLSSVENKKKTMNYDVNSSRKYWKNVTGIG
jgi:hypothetical protein